MIDKFKGVFTALITPFNKDGSVDFDSELVEGTLAKLVLNAFLIMSGVIMQRGEILCEFDSSSRSVTMNANGEGYSVSEDLSEILADKAHELDINTRNVQFFYAHEVAKSINYDIDIKIFEGQALLVLSKKS